MNASEPKGLDLIAWGSDRRYAVIRRDREHGDRFCAGRDVSVQGAGT